jgi:hypothetical protein
MVPQLSKRIFAVVFAHASGCEWLDCPVNWGRGSMSVALT